MLVATHSATFSADAVLKKTISATFSADAVLKTSRAGSFSADAAISAGTVSSSFTADGIVKRTNSYTFTLDAVSRRTQNGAVGTDSVIKKSRSATFTGDARFTSGLVHRSGSFTGNAVLRAFTRPTRVRLPMRNRHDRSDHDGVTLASAVTLSSPLLGFSTGTDLMTVASSLWGRVMNLESGGVTTKFRSATADAILFATPSSTFTADAVLDPVPPPNEHTGIFWMDAFIMGPATGEEEFARVTDPNDLGQSGFGPFWELLFDTDEATSSADGTFWRVQTFSNNNTGFNEPLIYDMFAEGPWANDSFTLEMRFLHTGAFVGTLDYPFAEFRFSVGEFASRRSEVIMSYDPTANPGTPNGELNGFGVDNDGFITTSSDSGIIDNLIPADTWMRFKWEHDQHGLDQVKVWVDGDTEPDWLASRDSSADSDMLRTQLAMRVAGWDLWQVDSITIT